MMEIEKHIELLLLYHDCVIVPELGGFVAHHVPAYYDETSQCFAPPRRAVGFNQMLHINDALLAQSYIATYGITHEEAQERIRQDVDSMKHTLYGQGFLELGHLGLFTLNAEGNMVFEPYESISLSPSLYGLSPYHFKTLTAAAIEPLTSLERLPSSMSLLYDTEEAAQLFSSQPSAVPSADSPQRTRIIQMAKKVAVAAVALFGVFLLSKGVLTPQSANQGVRQAKVFTANIPSAANETQAATDAAFSQVTFLSSQAVKEVLSVADHTPYYTLVLACGLPEANAQALCHKLSQQGIEASVTPSGKSFMVSHGRFASESVAYQSLMQHKGNDSFQYAWVNKVNP